MRWTGAPGFPPAATCWLRDATGARPPGRRRGPPARGWPGWSRLDLGVEQGRIAARAARRRGRTGPSLDWRPDGVPGPSNATPISTRAISGRGAQNPTGSFAARSTPARPTAATGPMRTSSARFEMGLRCSLRPRHGRDPHPSRKLRADATRPPGRCSAGCATAGPGGSRSRLVHRPARPLPGPSDGGLLADTVAESGGVLGMVTRTPAGARCAARRFPADARQLLLAGRGARPRPRPPCRRERRDRRAGADRDRAHRRPARVSRAASSAAIAARSRSSPTISRGETIAACAEAGIRSSSCRCATCTCRTASPAAPRAGAA